jgi:hypothetical protein
MCRSATLAMDVSITSINVASETANAMSQGLVFPFSCGITHRTLTLGSTESPGESIGASLVFALWSKIIFTGYAERF